MHHRLSFTLVPHLDLDNKEWGEYKPNQQIGLVTLVATIS